jgi:hypothetical protein
MKNQFFSVQLNQGLHSSEENKLFHCVEIESIPEIKPSYNLYYIEIQILQSHKSHFNDTMFHDVNVILWDDADCLKSLQKNGWTLSFISMPRGRGTDKLKYKITDPLEQELILMKYTDTRNFQEFCKRICFAVNQFDKASSLPNLNHHLLL